MFGRKPKPAPEPEADPPGDAEAPGWDAIDAACARVYGEAEPVHRSSKTPVALGGALEGISAHRADGHWHYVSYGLSELYDKESDDPAVNGWGYELTLRIAGDEPVPPTWGFNVVQSLAEQTQLHGVTFGPGHRVAVGQAIDGQGRLTALAFVADPQLGTISTVHGSLAFLQLVGITADELAEAKATSTAAVLAQLAVGNPLLVTDPRR